ncbi:MAG: c-type cytochrome, partial [Anaerolineales bacterium]
MKKKEPNYDLYLIVGLVLTLLVFAGFSFYWFQEDKRLDHSAQVLSEERLDRGYTIYYAHCAVCHGQQGEGGVGLPLNDEQMLKNTLDEILFSIVRSGVPNTQMPAWSVEYGGPLTDEDIRSVVSHIRAWETSETKVSQEEEFSLSGALIKGGCGGCHTISGVPGADGTVGPNLSDIGEVAQGYLDSGEYYGDAASVEEFIHESLVSPNAFIPTDCPGGHCQEGLMPQNFSDLLSEQELQAITTFLASLPADPEQIAAQLASAQAGQAPELTTEEWDKATQIFFDRCAGCHGVLRNGATGPALTPDRTLAKGTLALSSIIFNGTPRGMPDWGKQGILNEEEAELMARFVQNEPPQPPEMSLDQMLATWQVFIDPEDRPTSPQHDRDWQNFFAVTLRDAGQVAIIDGDTYEVVNNVNTGYAVHISRMSA